MRLRVVFLYVLFGLMAGSLFAVGDLTGSIKTSAKIHSSPIVRYRIDASQSKFMVHASRGGLAYFKGHNHEIAVRDFSGEASLNLDLINPATLSMAIRADSLEETSEVFTPQQKAIIKKELQEIVLETAKYPEITFKSTDVQGKINNGQFDVKIGGDMTLHGVTKHIVISSRVSVSGDTLRAQGEFTINRRDFNVKATSAFHGLVRVKDKLKFTFDIVAQRVS